MKSNPGMMMIAAAALLLAGLDAFAMERTQANVTKDAGTLSGAGSTFIAPLVERWIEDYRKLRPDASIAYDAVGSGEGIQRFVAGTVDFAASDGGMTDAQIAEITGGVRFVPATIGGVVLAYNIKGVGPGLKLPREVYMDIFSGKIRHWDDPRIQAANPDLALPHENIMPVVRQDRSGTTFAFTNHLGAISSEWRERPGVGQTVVWPIEHATMARGNEGVAARVKTSEGSIGYMEYGFAQRLGLPMAALQNRAGQFVAPEAPRIAKVFENSMEQMPTDLRLFVPDPAGDGVYPIVSLSWLILHGHYSDGAKGSLLKDFVRFGLTEGQKNTGSLGYVPLPETIASLARKSVDTVQANP